MAQDALTEREEAVLSALVRAYVDRGAPVGSAGLLERESLDVSPATVRKTLASLEDKGYVRQPHRSAGRLPTDKAYRFCVSHALGGQVTSAMELVVLRRQIEARLQQASADVIHGQLAEIIGDVSMQLGLVLAPRFERGRVARLELIRLAEGRLLLVVSLQAGPVRSLVVEVGSSVEPREVAGVAARLNERLAGLTVEEVRSTVRQRVGPLATCGAELLRVVVDVIEALTVPGGEALHVAGARHICSQPEFRDSMEVAGLFDLVEHKDELAGLLSDRQGVVVTIGEEHERSELRSCSLVTASYQVCGALGIIGVMGPTRMPYDRVVALVDYAASRAPDLVA